MKLLKIVALGSLSLVALLVLVGLFLPSSAHVERSTFIDAPAETVFALVDGFERSDEWSPWAKLDPNMTTRLEGPKTGVGAKMVWHSDDPQVGSGSQEVIASDPPRHVRTALDFGSEGRAEAAFHLEPQGEGVRVTWTLDSEFGADLVGRYFGLMLDRWVGPDYERGLARLEAVAEADAAKGEGEGDAVVEPAGPTEAGGPSAPSAEQDTE